MDRQGKQDRTFRTEKPVKIYRVDITYTQDRTDRLDRSDRTY